MRLSPLPAFRDNYIWCLDHDGKALVVDPGDATVVNQWLAAEGLSLALILITHHHADHTAGLMALKTAHSCQVVGPAEAIAGVDISLATNTTLEFPPFGNIAVLSTPGHTRGHICYYLTNERLLFAGDTLFSAGCGRAFEGSPEQLGASIEQLCQLPDDTRLCCAHEYTLSNLAFAAAVEPANPAIYQRQAEVSALREQGRPSLPVSLAEEKRYNPFLRSDVASVVAAASQHQGQPLQAGQETFAALRRWKDNF